MPKELMRQYDLFLDENDWDIYYWATQETPSDVEAANQDAADVEPWKQSPRAGEWAQTVGTFKPAYRPVPARWKGSEILELLRSHVASRRAGGESQEVASGTGMAFMPPLFDISQTKKP
jgi:uncharacterized cupin superfamily protein